MSPKQWKVSLPIRFKKPIKDYVAQHPGTTGEGLITEAVREYFAKRGMQLDKEASSKI